ncbi:MAG: tetratricopeptide repeat protein, partial [Chloroflexota bacterium]
NLGRAYQDIVSIRDLVESEKWYQRSLELTPESDSWSRAGDLGQLGMVAYERFEEAIAEKDIEKATEHITIALTRYHEALSLFPANAINELAVAHNQLGLIYSDIGEATQALDHYQKAVHYHEQADNHYGAANTRYNMAILFVNQRQFEHARTYAQAALKGFQRYGERTMQEQAKGVRLIEYIEQKMQDGK